MTAQAPLPDHVQQLTVDRLAQCTDARCIVMFGSRQRGEARPSSDIDVVVVGPSELAPDDRRGQLCRLFAHWPIRIDALWLTPDEAIHRIRSRNHFLIAVLSHGELVLGDVRWLRDEIDRLHQPAEVVEEVVSR